MNSEYEEILLQETLMRNDGAQYFLLAQASNLLGINDCFVSRIEWELTEDKKCITFFFYGWKYDGSRESN